MAGVLSLWSFSMWSLAQAYFLSGLIPKRWKWLQSLIRPRPGTHTLLLLLHSIGQTKIHVQSRFKVQGNKLHFLVEGLTGIYKHGSLYRGGSHFYGQSTTSTNSCFRTHVSAGHCGPCLQLLLETFKKFTWKSFVTRGFLWQKKGMGSSRGGKSYPWTFSGVYVASVHWRRGMSGTRHCPCLTTIISFLLTYSGTASRLHHLNPEAAQS